MKTLLMILLVILFTSCKTEIVDDNTEIIRIGINVCDSPFYANGNDTLSDAKSFDMAVKVLSNIRQFTDKSIFYKVEMYLYVPEGTYIIDNDADFKGAKIDLIPSFGCFQIKGTGIIIQDMNINYR